ncbi:MAG: AAA family ATPase [Chlamydiae bacterium]|nr:AAA family ATPase [Chlamydiota bacterium]
MSAISKINTFSMPSLSSSKTDDKPKTLSFWEKIKSVWSHSNPIEVKLNELENKIKQSHFTESEIAELGSLIQNIAKERHSFVYRATFDHLKRIVNSLNNAELNKLIAKVMELKIAQNNPQILDSLLDLLSISKIQSLIHNQKQIAKNLPQELAAIKSLASEIAATVPNPDVKNNEEQNEHINSFVTTIHNIFTTIWDTLSKAYDFDPENSAPASDTFEARSRFRDLIELVMLPAAAFKIIFDLLVTATAIWWVPYVTSATIALLIVAIIKIIEKRYANVPKILSNEYRNLTKLAREGKIHPVLGRQNEIDAIVKSLGKMDESAHTPLLIGKTGVGKTELIYTLAKQIVDGKHPSLKGKELYLIPTSSLLSWGSFGNGNYRSRLEVLLKDLKTNKKNAIIFLDEMHVLLDTKGGKDAYNLSQLFKSSLGDIHCIAATTKKEYENTIQKDEAFDSRLDKIEVEDLSSNDLLLAIKDHISQRFPEVRFSDPAIIKAIDLIKNDPKEAKTRRVLKLIDASANYINLFKSATKKNLQEKKQTLERLKKQYEQQNNFSIDSEEPQKLLCTIKALEEAIKNLEKEVSAEDADLAELSKLKLEQKMWKEKYFALAHKLNALDSNNPQFEKIAKTFLVVKEFMLKTAQSLSSEKEESLKQKGFKYLEVDEDLVKKVFENSYKQNGYFSQLIAFFSSFKKSSQSIVTDSENLE